MHKFKELEDNYPDIADYLESVVLSSRSKEKIATLILAKDIGRIPGRMFETGCGSAETGWLIYLVTSTMLTKHSGCFT